MGKNSITLLIAGVSIVMFIATLFLLLFIIENYATYNMFGEQELSMTDYELPEAVSCKDYNIGAEYRNVYGDAPINAMENGCGAVLGTYTENYQELSCYWNPDIFYMSCANTALVEFDRFCTDELNGYYTCDANIAYFGCQCNRPAPSQWIPDEPDEEPDDEQEQPPEDEDTNNDGVIETVCYDVVLPAYGDLGGLCRDNGYCGDTLKTCEHYWHWNDGIHRCGCLTTILSDVYGYCGVYCYEYNMLGSTCACPPDSYREIVTRSTFRCIPNGCVCEGAKVVC